MSDFQLPEEDELSPPSDDVAPEISGVELAQPPDSPITTPSAPTALHGSGDNHPIRTDLIRQYLEKRAARGPVDPLLEDARKQETLDRLTMGIGSAAGGVGDSIVRNARGFANSIAGRGFDVGEVGSGLPIPKAFDPASGPVLKYLAAKKAQEQQDSQGLRDAVLAQKVENATNPEAGSYAEQKLVLAKQEADRRLRQGDRGLDIKEDGQKLGAKRFEETEFYHKELLKLREEGLTESKAKDLLNGQKYALQRQRLGLADEKQEVSEGKGVVPGWKFQSYVDPLEGRQFKDAKTAAALADNSLEKMADMVKDGTFSRMNPLDQNRAIMDVYSHEVKPQINTAQKGGVFANGRAKLLEEAMSDPNSFRQMVLDSVSSNSINKINTFRNILRESVLLRGQALGGVPVDDVYGGGAGEISSARSERPGSPEFKARTEGRAANPKPGALSTDTRPPLVEKTVMMVDPQGNRHQVKASKVQAASQPKFGWKVAQDGK